jgi:molecular chaperone GrpE
MTRSKEEPKADAGKPTTPSAQSPDSGTPVSPAPSAPAAPPSPEEIEQLRAQAAKAAENWDKLLRTTADLDNYKKRAARERQEAIAYANASLMQALLPILDNLDMALSAATGAAEPTAKSLQTGVAMIGQQLRNALGEAGLEEIDAAGKAFDPNLHEAVSQQESEEVPEGQVFQQLRKGYKLRDRLLRPASVIVAKKPATAPAAEK